MCIAPIYIPERGSVACRNCWQCRANRVNDLVGRCIAETTVSTGTLAVTLTYRGDVVNAATLVYSDVQKFFKSLRSAGHKVRYIVAGEYGSKKGRAHWHAILFFSSKVPDVPLNTNVDWKFWPHGHAFFQRPDYHGFRYVLKYVLKDQSADVHRSHLAMSKKPPLGHGFFIRLADSYIDQNLAPQSPRYSFRDQFDDKGNRRSFWLQGRMREIFLEYYLDAYQERHGREYPFSDFVLEHEDKMARDSYVMTDEDWQRRFATRSMPAPPAPPDHNDEDGKPVYVAAYVVLPGDYILTRYSNDTVSLDYGDQDRWLIETDAELERALGAIGVSPQIRSRLSVSTPAESLQRSKRRADRATGARGGSIGNTGGEKRPPAPTALPFKERPSPRKPPRRLRR